MAYHVPVLLSEIVSLSGSPRRMADATLGDGGHAEAFLRLGADVLGVDRDPGAIRRARTRLDGLPLQTMTAAYDDPAVVARLQEFRPDLALFDLGVSSRQLDDATLGFSFRSGAPLDMRMDPTGSSAAEVLNTAPEDQLREAFADFADEPKARRLAAEIVRRRKRAPFATSDDLVNAIRAVLGPRSGRADFARLFQAVRIRVNAELDRLARALPIWRDGLTPGGLLLVISYHSGEDRVVKRAFQEWARACVCPPEWPVCRCRGRALGALDPRRPIRPGPAEIASNPRARSAILRGFRIAS